MLNFGYCPIKVCKLLFLIFVFENYKKGKKDSRGTEGIADRKRAERRTS